jgi:uncharacterized protein
VADSLSSTIASVPFVDHHVHAPVRDDGPLTLSEFRRPFTESSIEETWTVHLSSQIGYRWMVRELAVLLDVDPTEDSVVLRRAAIEPEDYHLLLANDANLGDCYADDLFAAGQCYELAEWSRLLGGRRVYRVLRVETFVEQGYEMCPALDDALERLVGEVRSARENGVVSLKSISGYRTGLAIEPPSMSQRRSAAAAYQSLREESLGGRSGRIADKALVDTIVWEALVAAIPARLPMQFHVALGDDDIVLTRNDPTLMRSLFQHEPFRVLPLVLLHCYPYHRQAGYLASIYPNAYVDLGLTIPIVGPAAPRIIEETLELTPVSQLLASSDGHMTPEFQWFGVRVWRWALERSLRSYLEIGVASADDIESMAGAILRDNAHRIYPQYRA